MICFLSVVYNFITSRILGFDTACGGAFVFSAPSEYNSWCDNDVSIYLVSLYNRSTLCPCWPIIKHNNNKFYGRFGVKCRSRNNDTWTLHLVNTSRALNSDSKEGSMKRNSASSDILTCISHALNTLYGASSSNIKMFRFDCYYPERCRLVRSDINDQFSLLYCHV